MTTDAPAPEDAQPGPVTTLATPIELEYHFTAGHAQHREGGPVGTASELWSFDVLELEGPAPT